MRFPTMFITAVCFMFLIKYVIFHFTLLFSRGQQLERYSKPVHAPPPPPHRGYLTGI